MGEGALGREGKGEEGMEGEGAGEGKEEKGRGRAIPQNENPGYGLGFRRYFSQSINLFGIVIAMFYRVP